MQPKVPYGKIALSSILIALLNGCGGTATSSQSQADGTAQPTQSQKVSPFVEQTLAPSDMPQIESDDEKADRGYARASMSADRTTVKVRKTVTVSLKNMPRRYDWIGLFYKDDASKRDNLLTYKWTGGKKSVTIRIANTLKRAHKERLGAGAYELRAFTQSGKYIELARLPINVTDGAQQNRPQIKIAASDIRSGDAVPLTLTDVSGKEGEWIGIFPKGSSNSWENTWSWTYTEEAIDGHLTLEGVPAGAYEIRLFADKDMTLLASVPLTVHANAAVNTTFETAKDTYATTESIIVDYRGMPGNGGDWIGLFEKGAGNDMEEAIDYYTTDGQTNGSVTFPAINWDPQWEYAFEIRAFHEGSDTPVYTKPITITGKGVQPESRKVAIFADEHDPHNRLLAVDYDNMELLAEISVEGSRNHHADVVGDVKTAKYVIMVPKKSNFITVYNLHDKTLVKKIELPFQPRSADAFNAAKNLVLLTSGNRPAAVLLDATTWEIVGEAGMNNTCNLKFNEYNYHPWYYKKIVYSWKNIPSDQINCIAPDFGGQLISGHPRWLGTRHFAILDRANRLIHVYKLVSKDRNGQWKIKLTDSVPTSTSIHQIIPSGHNDNIYYGMSEGNGNGDGIAPVMYKWKFVNGRLKQLAKTPLVTEQTVTIMKDVGAYDLYTSYWSTYKRIKPYYNYRYPTYFPSKFAAYYPQNEGDYYKQYYNNVKQKIAATYHNDYPKQVPVEVKQQLNSLGGHNLYISPAVNGREYLWGAVASGQTFVVDTQTMNVTNVVKSDKGAGHVNFQQNGDYAIITNHKSRNVTIANYKSQTFVTNVKLPYEKENISPVLQSHAPYVTLDDNYFINTWTDGGVFFKINLNTLTLEQKSLYTGGVPIQGNYYPNYKGD